MLHLRRLRSGLYHRSKTSLTHLISVYLTFNSTLAVKIFTKHLYPELSISDDDETTIESLPLLNTGTRNLMADIIIFLTKDDRQQYQDIVELLAALVPYNTAEDSQFPKSHGTKNADMISTIHNGTELWF